MSICHNPACHRPVARRDAYLRSVSLTLVAFCSSGCVDMFDQLDKAARVSMYQDRAPRLMAGSVQSLGGTHE